MDEAKLPRDWSGKLLETAFYRNNKEGTFMFIKREGSNFFIFTPDCPERKLLQYLDGQYKPFERVDPWEYIAEREEEITKARVFIQTR